MKNRFVWEETDIQWEQKENKNDSTPIEKVYNRSMEDISQPENLEKEAPKEDSNWRTVNIDERINVHILEKKELPDGQFVYKIGLKR